VESGDSLLSFPVSVKTFGNSRSATGSIENQGRLLRPETKLTSVESDAIEPHDNNEHWRSASVKVTGRAGRAGVSEFLHQTFCSGK
jgi:hypothetical protein